MNLPKISKIILLAALTMGCFASASDTLSIDNISRIGRLLFFKNNFGSNIVLPTGFAPELECFAVGAKNMCWIRILNTVTEEESNQIAQMNPVRFLSKFDISILKNIDEKLMGIPEILPNRTSYLKNIAITGTTTPYVYSSFSVSTERANELQKLFVDENLGHYTLTLDLMASNTNYYLAVSDSKELKNRLLALNGEKIKAWKVRTLVKEILKKSSISAIGFTPEDQIPILTDKIISKYFIKVGFATYIINYLVVTKIDDQLEVFSDDTIYNIPYRCETTLELKKGAQPVTNCAEGA